MANKSKQNISAIIALIILLASSYFFWIHPYRNPALDVNVTFENGPRPG
jgi:hypothetical protein